MSRRFNFRGNAVGAAASALAEHPYRRTVFASISLPIIGGRAAAEAGRCDMRGKMPKAFRFDRTQSQAVGRFLDKETVVTTVDSEVDEFAVKDLKGKTRLRAGRLSAALRSKKRVGDGQEMAIRIGKVKIRAFRLRYKADGEDRARFHTVEIDTNSRERVPNLWALHSIRDIESTQESSRDYSRRIKKKKDEYVYSPIDECDIELPKSQDVIVHGNVIAVRGFARIFLAEVRRSEGTTRFNLVRVERGNPPEFQDSEGGGLSPQGGVRLLQDPPPPDPPEEVTAVELESNGSEE